MCLCIGRHSAIVLSIIRTVLEPDWRVVAIGGEPDFAKRTGRNKLQALAVADLDHELIWVVEEELVY